MMEKSFTSLKSFSANVGPGSMVRVVTKDSQPDTISGMVGHIVNDPGSLPRIYVWNNDRCGSAGGVDPGPGYRYSWVVDCRNFVEATILAEAAKEGSTMQDIIAATYEKTTDAVVVEREMGHEIGAGFIDGLLLTTYKTDILTEARRREALRKKQEEKS